MSFLFAFLVIVPVWASEIIIEAEDAELLGVVVDTSRAGYSGSGYVTGFDEPGDSLRFQFEVEEGVYEVFLNLSISGRIVPYTFWIDGKPVSKTIIGTGESFAERKLGEFWLSQGSHILVVKGSFDVDYLKMALLEFQGPTAPTEPLTDPEATASAKALHRYLLSEYGNHILSGQQDLEEIRYMQNTTGKMPTVGSFDLIDYSPSRVACGTRPGRSAENWIDWAGQRGIVSLMWHWNAPTDLIDDNCNTSDNAAGQEWWSGFYTRATTFDLAAVLADTTSERYALLLRDIDAIAQQLQKFEGADMPVLWRPLHEAAGGWFWWGARGAEPFVELWRLLYHRLVDYHGLHNLIWVYTHEPDALEWYPGDEYVDIVSRDVYANSQEATMQSDWIQLQEVYGDRKLVTLSESGTLPNPEIITDYGIWWSWFSIWNGSFIRNIDQDYLRQVYESEHVLTRDELPDWRALTTATEPGPPEFSPRVTLYPNPSRGVAILRAVIPTTAEVRVEVFDLTGRQVDTYELGLQPAGALETTIQTGDTAGVYLVRLIAGHYTAHQTLVTTP